MEDLGPMGDQLRGGMLAMALAVGDQVPAVAAGPDVAQARNIRAAANSTITVDRSTENRLGIAVRQVDGHATDDPVAWTPPDSFDTVPTPLQLPPAPIVASPAGWDGEPNAHSPLGTTWY